MLDTTFLGTAKRQLRNSATYEACQHNCQMDSTCHYWTWDLYSKLCVLRDEAPYGYVTDASTVGILAGPKYCPNDDVCIEQADYVGYDLEAIEDGSVLSAVACRTICRHTEGCEFWTWVKATKNCYLKTEDALLGKTNGLSSIGRFSGPRECFMQYGCLEPNTAYLSPTSTQVKNVTGFKDCESRCKQSTDCSHWTFLPTTMTCILLASTDAQQKVPLDGALSGSDCDTTKTTNEYKCLTLGVRYKNAEMALISGAANANDCHYECNNNVSCEAFTFEEGVGCYLYDKDPSQLTAYPLDFPTASSGTPKCGPSSVGEADTCYVDGTLEGASFYAYNAGECAAACTEVPSCMHWTYNPKRRSDSCIFHKAGATKQVTCLGSTSGGKTPQHGTYGYYRYDAPAVTVANIASADLCRAQCADNDMAFWTYYPLTQTCKLHEDGSYNRVRDLSAVCGTVVAPAQ
ncbi:PAN domain-containing protein [Cyclospora cayetanensis]|uniref:PAN domain-containing protein n=1 Tax=Cyclospora cayetanensis TaxID=88456 RepID=A0A1D3D2G3_9EIME|nr:PAN domain-containing protein [Cyclospora cayetanensis]